MWCASLRANLHILIILCENSSDNAESIFPLGVPEQSGQKYTQLIITDLSEEIKLTNL